MVALIWNGTSIYPTTTWALAFRYWGYSSIWYMAPILWLFWFCRGPNRSYGRYFWQAKKDRTSARATNIVPK